MTTAAKYLYGDTRVSEEVERDSFLLDTSTRGFRQSSKKDPANELPCRWDFLDMKIIDIDLIKLHTSECAMKASFPYFVGVSNEYHHHNALKNIWRSCQSVRHENIEVERLNNSRQI